MENKYIKKFDEMIENSNEQDLKIGDTIKIETSIGIIEIPVNHLNKSIDSLDRSLSKEEWVLKLKKLYEFVSVETRYETPGWLFVDLSDGYYGSPEYKIMNFNNELLNKIN